jgi:predicted ATPase
MAEPELLARHLSDAGLFEKAVPWWQRAGERATERSANREAIAHLKRSIEILGRLPESPAREEQELLLQVALMTPLAANEGYASAAIERAASRAVELGRRFATGLPAQLHAVQARSWLAIVHTHRGKLRAGLALQEENLAFAESLGDAFRLSRAHQEAGRTRFHLGDLAEARRHLEKALALYDPERDRKRAARFGFDVAMGSHSFLAHVLWDQGFPDEALARAEEAIAAARAAGHPFSVAWALGYAANIHQLRGDVGRCLERALATFDLATEQVLPYYVARALVFSGWALAKEGQAEEGLARLCAGCDGFGAIGTRVWRSHSLALFADACLAAGRIEEGLAAVREGLTEVEATDTRFYEAELNRLEAEFLLASKEPDESGAEASFRQAIATARGQQAKSWELRAAASLARLLARQAKREEARALLAPVYGWFTEGFDTADLKDAATLISELA